MKSNIIPVSSKKDMTDLVMREAEKVAVYEELSHENEIQLRLLSEEMMGMMRAIAGDVYGDFWIENEGSQFELHIRVGTKMDYLKRKMMLDASSSGKNEAHKGFMGKIRAFFEPLEGMPLYYNSGGDNAMTEMVWTMNAYQREIDRAIKQNKAGAREAWDELEKSVIRHIADDIRVSISGCLVEMVVYKTL